MSIEEIFRSKEFGQKSKFFDSPKKCLYLITDGGELRRRGVLFETIADVLKFAGEHIGWVQLREQVIGENGASDEEIIKLSERLLLLCRATGAKLIINRNIEVARKVGADGVHLGKIGQSIATVREELGSRFLIGYSAHSIEEAVQASNEGVDYLFLSPIFKTISKTNYGNPLGLAALKRLTQIIKTPVIALGGITKENARMCRENEATAVAGIGSIILASQPGLAAKELARAFYKED